MCSRNLKTSPTVEHAVNFLNTAIWVPEVWEDMYQQQEEPSTPWPWCFQRQRPSILASSVFKIKYPDKKQFKEETGLIWYTVPGFSSSLWGGQQQRLEIARISSTVKSRRRNTHMFTWSFVLNSVSPFLYTLGPLTTEWCHPSALGPPSSVN